MKSMRVRHCLAGAVGAVGALFGEFEAEAQTTNRWTNGVSGFWSDATSWTAGVPTNSHAAVLITNVATKTVTINSATPAANLTISNLTLRGVGAGINTLFLDDAGTTTPLRVLNQIILGTNSVLRITNSVLSVEAPLANHFFVDGSVTNLAGAEIIATNVGLRIGSAVNTRGSFVTMGGLLRAREIIVGIVGGAGTLTLAGGTNILSQGLAVSASPNSTGVVWVTGGQLVVTNGSTSVGNSTSGEMTVSNGVFLGGAVQVGNVAGSSGTLTLAGGTNEFSNAFTIGNSANSTGAVWITGGLLRQTFSFTGIGSQGVGQMTMSNGTVQVLFANVGQLSGSRGTLTSAGGTMSVFTKLALGSADCSSTGTVVMAGGALFVTNVTTSAALDVHSGTLLLLSGTLAIDQLVVTNACGRFIKAGGSLSITVTNISPGLDADGDGIINGSDADPFTSDLIPGGTNSWTSSLDGLWHVASNWSLTSSPDIVQSAILITNAATKTVTINSATPAAKLIISNLTVSGFAGTNTLALSNAATPLRILRAFTIGSNGVLQVTNSVLRLDGIGVTNIINGNMDILGGGVVTGETSRVVVGSGIGNKGTLTLDQGTLISSNFSVGALNATGTLWMTGNSAQLIATNGSSSIGATGPTRGRMVVSNGTWLAQNVIVDGGSTLEFAGGTSRLFSPIAASSVLSITRSGTLWMVGGTLLTTNNDVIVGTLQSGQVTISNGTWLANNASIGYNAGARGTLTLAGGTINVITQLSVGVLPGSTGVVLVTGGQLTATNNSSASTVSGAGSGELTLSNGLLRFSGLIIGNGFNAGTITLAGGTNVVANELRVGSPGGSTGTVWITGDSALLSNTTTTVAFNGVGRMTVSNGNWRAWNAFVAATGFLPGGAGTLTIAGGTNSVYTSMTVGTADCSFTGTVLVAGGRLFITNSTANSFLEVRSGTVSLNSGTLTIDHLILTNPCGRFLKTGGMLSINTTNLTAGLDADGDGASNGDEQTNGTDPFDPFDPLPLLTNSWNNTLSGKWEAGGNWSLAVAPATNQFVFVTNATTKAVSIDAVTTNSPATMTVAKLTVSAPAGTANTLQLTNAGTATPLRVLNALNITSGGNVLVTNSQMRVEGGALVVNAATANASITVRDGGTFAAVGPLTVSGGASSTGTVLVTGGKLVITNTPATVTSGTGLVIDGSLTLTNGGSITVSNLLSTVVGNTGQGTLTVFGGALSANNLLVGNLAGSRGTATFAGGTNTLSGILSVGQSANGTGAVWITGGQLVVTNSTSNLILGNLGIGQMTLSNGTLLARQIQLGPNGGSGTLTIAGGTNSLSGLLTVAQFSTSQSALWLNDGLLVVTNAPTTIANGGLGRMTISNGTWLASSVVICAATSGRGTLTLAGGTTTIRDNLRIAAIFSSTGTVWITGGMLATTNAQTSIGDGGIAQMTLSNGTWLAKNVVVGAFAGSQGTLTIAGGTSSVYSNLSVGVCGAATGIVNVAAGALYVTNINGDAALDVRGTINQSGGLLFVNRLVITNACGRVNFTGGSLVAIAQILTPEFDADGDGVPNGFDPGPLDPTDTGNDPDGDGFTNLQEYQAGTSPTNSASFLGITSITQLSTNILITWQTGSGKTNALERTAGVAGSFSNNFAAIFTVTNTVGTTTNYLDIGAATNFPSQYYRIRLVP